MLTLTKSCLVPSLLALAMLAPASVAAGTASHSKNHDLASKAIACVNAMAHAHFKSAEKDFTTQIQTALPPAKLQAVWNGMIQQVGAYESQKKTTIVDAQGYTSVVVNTQFKLAKINIVLTFNDVGKVAGLHFDPAPPSSAANRASV